MKKIGIIGAMQVEIDFLVQLMADKCNKTQEGTLIFYEGKIHGKDVVVVKSGVGKVNAALCAQRLIMNYKCTNIINTGIAGALASGLKVMDFVVSKDAVYHDMDATGFGYKKGQIPQMDAYAFNADESMISAVKEAFNNSELAKNYSIIEGRIATGDQFISDKAIKNEIKTNFDPACVEMEGAAIAHACHLSKVPFVIIRCMSDMADDVITDDYNFNEPIAAELSARLVESIISYLN